MGMAVSIVHGTGLSRLRLATAMAWDAGRALTNALLVASLGAPLLRVLRRASRRANFVDAARGTTGFTTG